VAAKDRWEDARVDFKDIIYAVDGPLGVITLNRPAYRNAQGYRMLDEIDQAFGLAKADSDVRVVVIKGAGGVFSTGHDLGTPEGTEYREALGAKPGIERYDQFKHYNLDLLLAWRNFPKPTIAMVDQRRRGRPFRPGQSRAAAGRPGAGDLRLCPAGG
jgi:enoyl-CoA hydratase